MTLEQQNAKLALIFRMTSPDELDGYEAEARCRGMFPGEMAALMARRVALPR